jgi:hypothetical protein
MKLKEIVARLVEKAEQTGKDAEQVLEHGLVLCVNVSKKATVLKLKRRGSKPGLVEWNTVTGVWPYPIGPITPVAEEEKGYSILRASWPTQVRLINADC